MMRRVRWICPALATVVLLHVVPGCGMDPEALTPVRGKVSYRGVPLSAGMIVFTPDALRGTTGSLSRSEIHSDGTYILQTNSRPGATVGWHRVTVMAIESTPQAGAEGAALNPRSLLPEKYRDPELSGLSCQVRGGRMNSIDFDLD